MFKNKNREKKRPIKLKLRVELIVFQYLRVGYFPDTFNAIKKLLTAYHIDKSSTGKIIEPNM
ncbi:MAG: hypothetical protein DQL95_00150 [Lactobacillus helveticus]|nr:MAG: hypothetical protein DQL95_00150 [Lactobacillus helveticus]